MSPTPLSNPVNAPSPDLEEELIKFRKDLKENALRMMRVSIPEKIISLTKSLNVCFFSTIF